MGCLLFISTVYVTRANDKLDILVASNSHPVGTLAMMPKELGGVVDDKLMVYGTKNVRVVDASVFPFQVSGHLTSTLYALSERAADIIKGLPQ